MFMNTALEPVLAPNQNRSSCSATARFAVSVADRADRQIVAHLRHEVYSRELGQHRVNPEGRLQDAIDDWNILLLAKIEEEICGFITVTPPRCPAYSIDKYFPRQTLPFEIDRKLYEIRLLTVMRAHRGSDVALLLMHAALRWVQAHGGTRIVAIGRREILNLYRKVGLHEVGMSTVSGAVTYDLLLGSVAEIQEKSKVFSAALDHLAANTDWQLSFPFRTPAPCFHGGAFFTAIGPRFDDLTRRDSIINADVLDAWFPPAPRVVASLQEHLPWLLQTSPPAQCEGLVAAISQARGVELENILPGAGSSDLIFRALRHWLCASSRVLILDPTYGEYAHVLERVIGCKVDCFKLSREDGYAVDLDSLEETLAEGHDLAVLVNPNSPTGKHIPARQLERLLGRIPTRTRIWVDETYVEYAGPKESIEPFAAKSENVVVCKSMSKVYALSGARVAYLCASPHQLESLRSITPPWIVGLPSQVAAVRALADPGYYAARYQQTAELRKEFAAELCSLGIETVDGIANFILCQLPDGGPDAATLVEQCRKDGLFLRDAVTMSQRLGSRALRIAVKDRTTNRRMIEIIRAAIRFAG